MTPLLSILICHIPERYDFFKRLSGILDPQLEKHKGSVECLVDDSRYKTIGRKRNDLMTRAAGKYVCFIDDDDFVCDNYIELLLHGMKRDVDCCSLKGIITEDGNNPLLFEHSIKYRIYKTITDAAPNEIHYERYPNHLNCIRASIAKQFPFPEKNHGEDYDWATELFKSQLVKTEYYIDQVIYYYDYRRK
jgi:hypothetical protein